MIRVLYAGGAERAGDWTGPLARAFEAAGLEVDLSAHHPPEAVDVIVYAPNPKLSDFTPYVNARAVLSLWAGVETIVANETLTQPLARMVDPGLTEGMVEYVCGHVLRHHLGLDAYIGAREWRPDPPPLARSRRVGVLGLGALGSACASALAALNFEVTGWARSPREIARVRCLSGEAGFTETLAASEILVLLLPHTSETADSDRRDRARPAPQGRGSSQPGPRRARRGVGPPRRAGERTPFPRHPRHVPHRTAAGRSPVLDPSQGDGDPAHRLRHPAGDGRNGDRREHPPRHGRRAVAASRGSRGRILRSGGASDLPVQAALCLSWSDLLSAGASSRSNMP